MKRIFAIIICLALMSVCFCGCAEEDWAYETVEYKETYIVAKPKYDETVGRYWQFISY